MTSAMNTFLFAFAAVALVSLGGRDQLLVARLAQRLGRSGGLLAIGALASALSALLMAAAGLAMALLVEGPAADVLVAFGLLIAAGELAWQRGSKLPEEPTRSLFATLIVLLARQVGDAARFLVFAFAASGSAWGAAAGGALGGCAALAIGALAGGDIAHWPLRPLRLVLAAGLAIGAVAIVLDARGIVG
jgi:putative Ca2+/H+ antiporter (TMEM165/GDT1 family)